MLGVLEVRSTGKNEGINNNYNNNRENEKKKGRITNESEIPRGSEIKLFCHVETIHDLYYNEQSFGSLFIISRQHVVVRARIRNSIQQPAVVS